MPFAFLGLRDNPAVEIEHQTRHFWQNMNEAHRQVLDNDEVADWIWKFDAVLYDVGRLWNCHPFFGTFGLT